MPTQCSRDLFGYEVVEGRQVVAAFDGGEVSSDAGGLLLGATDRANGLVERFAGCFEDRRVQAQVEHSVAAMVAQRVFGIAAAFKAWAARSLMSPLATTSSSSLIKPPARPRASRPMS
jgi:hypothetical protein